MPSFLFAAKYFLGTWSVTIQSWMVASCPFFSAVVAVLKNSVAKRSPRHFERFSKISAESQIRGEAKVTRAGSCPNEANCHVSADMLSSRPTEETRMERQV